MPFQSPTSIALTFADSWSGHDSFLLSAAVSGQVVLEQHPRELTVQEGKAVTFQCSMEGDSMSDYYMYWYRQNSRGTLEWIYMDGDIYGEGFQDRFVGKLESSMNRFTLQIVAARQGDAATYYCRAEPPWSSSAAEWTKNQQMGKTDLSAFLSSSCSLGILSGNGRCRKHPWALVALKGSAGRVVEGLVAFMVQENLFWELQRLFGQGQL